MLARPFRLRSAVRTACGLAAAIAAVSSLAGAAPAAKAPAPRLWGARPSVTELEALGRLIFDDASLSASGRLSCASCHDHAAGLGPGPHTPSPFTDGDPAHAGTRAIPALRYAQYTPRFTEHMVEQEEEGPGEDEGPTGGLMWDGRAETAREQALMPLFAENEMANTDVASLARKVASARWAARFRQAVSAPGRNVFDDPKLTVDWLGYALEVYEQGREFRPFDSRYDQALAGKLSLTPQEVRGLRVFMNPQKGNCEACHPASRAVPGAAPVFTNNSFVAAAAPRRAGLPPIAASSASAAYPLASTARGAEVDLGLCRSGRAGLADDPKYCGMFRTPTLRNAAVRTTFFHNGSLHSLREVLEFYNTRDIDPGRWYSRNPDGSVHLYDDVPPEYVASVDHEVPFDPLPGNKPRLEEKDIDDLMAFLETLTDADLVPKKK